MPDQPDTVSIVKACELAGVSRRSIYTWMDQNKVQWIRTAGGQRRILVQSLFTDGNIRAAGSQRKAGAVVSLFNAIYHLFEQQPLIFWAALITIVFALCVLLALAGIKLGARNWLSDAPATHTTVTMGRFPLIEIAAKTPTFSGPAAKGFQKPLTLADRDAIIWEGFEKMRGARR
jgi:hypothetical protein